MYAYEAFPNTNKPTGAFVEFNQPKRKPGQKNHLTFQFWKKSFRKPGKLKA